MNQAYLKNILSAKFDFNVWKELFDKFFPKVEIFTTVAKISDIHVKDGGHIGNIRLDDERSLAIFRFEVADNVIISRNRKSLRDIAAKYVDQGLIHGALVFYYSQNQDDYRLTFIAKQTYFNENGELVKKETAPKRYTFLLGKNEPCTTAASRLMELADKKSSGSVFLADVTDTFSVERLNKEFFKGYKEQYAKFLKLLEDKKQHRDYVKKMLGRLVFLQFLQKKGWMGVPASNENWEGGDKNYLANLIERYKGNDRILSDVLEPLFFDTLNKERVGDIADSRLGDNMKIPYLNGGLFDKDKIDALDIDFPYSYFEDLMKFFNEYNFTIDENDPDDAEVGVDPEMLGHIFENLLEDNKDKGAFYTPKEIVQYMCRQSVIQYLKTHEPDEKYSLAIERLINESVVEPVLQNKETASRFIELLKDVKVCDPAIGSGAFPMGILYVLYYALHHLQSHAEPNKSFDSTKTKRNIIQNNIFGVDIEQGAVDIARLRFWLALVVDADEPQPLPNLDYKITCGNSLLNRYALDTPLDNVFIEYNKDKNDDDKLSLAKYKQLVNDYTNTSNHAKKDLFRKTIEEIKKTFKTELSKKEINKIVSVKKDIYDLEQPNLFGEELTKAQKSELKKLKAKLEKLESEREDVLNNKVYEDAFEWRFEFPQLLNEKGDFTGFDIVIGNPPYLRIQGIRDNEPEFADELVKKYQSATGSFDLYVTFAERGLQIIKAIGIVNYIMPDKWTNAAFGKGLRDIISNKKAANKIISFGAYQVFNASTYTALQWFKPESDCLNYYQLDRNLETNNELDIYLKSIKYSDASVIGMDKLDKNPWVLTVGATSNILQKLELHPRRIADIFDKIFQGLATSKDDVYFLYNCVENDKNIIGYSKQMERNIEIEKGLVKPLLKGEDVHRYDDIKTDRYVIFPYKLIEGKAILYTEKELSDTFPLGYSYLKDCEDILRGREKGRLMNDEYWFRYIYPKNLVLFDHEKLVAPEISLGGNFAYDDKGEFYSTTKVYGYIKKSNIVEGYKFWMALFNSRLFWFFIQNTGYVLRGGYYTFKTDYVNPFPVPKVIPQKMEEAIVRIVDNILMLKRTNPQADTSELENQIDLMVYKLYGLTYDEVLIVDPETLITREEYEKISN